MAGLEWHNRVDGLHGHMSHVTWCTSLLIVLCELVSIQGMLLLKVHELAMTVTLSHPVLALAVIVSLRR